MSTFLQIKQNIGLNLNDIGQVRFTDADLNTSIQAAYDDIIVQTQSLIKKVTLNWPNNLTYFDFKNDPQFAVADYMATVAIFNNENNQWLQDDLNIQQFDNLRDNWEVWMGAPCWWAFAAYDRTAIVPKKEIGTGTFDLYYWATAPTISDGSSPLVATDQQDLLEFFAMADQLESVDEFIKASGWWIQYYEALDPYIQRMKSLSQADLRNLI